MARGRDIVARWCALAEQRLEYLTELFETGRWRRFHSELAFLENIQEAKTAVETWRGLATREASRQNSAVDISWHGRAGRGAAARRTRCAIRFIGSRRSRRRFQLERRRSTFRCRRKPIACYSDEAPSAPAPEMRCRLRFDATELGADAIERR